MLIIGVDLFFCSRLHIGLFRLIDRVFSYYYDKSESYCFHSVTQLLGTQV